MQELLERRAMQHLTTYGAPLRIFSQGLLPKPFVNQDGPARQQETREGGVV